MTKGLHSVQPVPEAGSQFKFQILRRFQHFAANILRNGLIVAQQELTGLLYGLPVLGGAFPLLAPAGALVHVVVQAGPVLSNIPGKLPGAVRKLQGQADRFHNGMGNAPAAIGPIVARAVIRYFAYQSDPGIFLFHIQSEVRIPLVILEKDIVLWQVAFDKRAFQN